MMFQCLECTKTGEDGDVVEFDSRADWMAHMKAHKSGGKLPMPTKKAPPPAPVMNRPEPAPPVPVKVQPIELIYTYIGQCPTCKTNVETLEINIEGTINMVAYCTHCKEQKATQKVISIKKR